MIIYHNIGAINANRNLGITGGQLSKSMERLSSGLRINRAADDAAGLAISERMRTQISGMNVASKNSQDSISMIQVAESAYSGVTTMLQRMRELAVQAANGTNSGVDQENLQSEFLALTNEIDAVGKSTLFNKTNLVQSTNGVIFQVGANVSDQLSVTFDAIDKAALGSAAIDLTALNIGSGAEFATAISAIDAGIDTVSQTRANLGSVQNRLEYVIDRLRVISENTQAAESRLRDTDMAAEMVNFTRLQILQQSGIAMLAQANLAPQAVLQLLR